HRPRRKNTERGGGGPGAHRPSPVAARKGFRTRPTAGTSSGRTTSRVRGGDSKAQRPFCVAFGGSARRGPRGGRRDVHSENRSGSRHRCSCDDRGNGKESRPSARSDGQ